MLIDHFPRQSERGTMVPACPLEGGTVIAERLERFFEALYRRLGARYLSVMRGLVALIAIVLANPMGIGLLAYSDPEPAEVVRSLAIGNGGLALAMIGYMLPSWRRASAPIQRWLDGDRDEETTLAAWRQARRLTWDGFRPAIIAAMAVFPVVASTAAIEYGLSLVEIAVTWFALMAMFSVIAAVAWPAVELFHRPLRRDLARQVAPQVASTGVEAPLGARMWWSFVAVSMTTGMAVAFVAVPDGSLVDLGRLMLLVVVSTVLVGGVIVVLLTRSLMAPAEDVLATIDAVRAGDLSARVEVTTNDEVGFMAAAFNDMLVTIEQAANEVRASRARIVAASDAERARIERNIHDGAQQQLTALLLQLEVVGRQVVSDPEQAIAGLEDASGRLRDALAELRELAQGLHPSALSLDGLASALELLAERSTVPVDVRAASDRYPEAIESTAYFVASEALANVAKYAQASQASVALETRDGRVVLEVVDDGVGGAHLGAGSGLMGLVDRVEAVGGSLAVDSPPGAGTTVRAVLPVETGALAP